VKKNRIDFTHFLFKPIPNTFAEILSMQKLQNFVTGKWITGDGKGQSLFDAVTGEEIGKATTEGLDFASMLEFGRKVGNPALRKLTFHERGRMLRALALHLSEKKEKFFPFHEM